MIKPCLWPQIEFFSSRGQGSWPLCVIQQQPFILGGLSRILQDKMGANNSSLTPLNCILKNWDRFDSQGLKKTHLVFLCDTAWPWYPLEDDERWPVGGCLKYNTVLQLDRFCRKQGQWVEVTYLLPFFLCKICQACVLMVQIWVWHLQLLLVLLLCPCTRGSQLSTLKVREHPQERSPWSQWKPKLRFKLPK